MIFFSLITIVSPGVIPRRPDGGVDIYEVEARLLKGSLHPLHIICAPHSGQNKKIHSQFIADKTSFISKFLFFLIPLKAIHNLPRAREKIIGMGPNSLMQGFVVAGAAPAQHVTDPLKNVADKAKGQKFYKNRM